MNRRLEALACRIHDAVACSGITEEEQEMACDLYQQQAQQVPCPACKAIEGVLSEHEQRTIKGERLALVVGTAGGLCLFLAGVGTMYTDYSVFGRCTTVVGLAVVGMDLLWGNLLKKRLL